ncbi:hypothetical protein P4J10_23080 [Bacillus cereus]|uniref:hypothetical protein n=1 Tax=Bacillus thuringiensis TaxID=1428 RepID=UPI000B42E60F|nr:hypothetical protein [Bacillus thuringiensis]MEB9469479.1 hypothetical protein [Bacillus cereus]OUA18954.1 hypothetical protein BK776_27950 [Bacillus thuringiensis serovar aizawai]
MVKKQQKKETPKKPTLKAIENNLLTVAENKMIEMLESKKYKEVDEFYTMEAAFVSTKTGESRASHAKMDKTQTEVIELDRIKTKGEFYGCKISYTVVKKRQKTPTIITLLVAFKTDDMELLDEPIEQVEEQLTMF